MANQEQLKILKQGVDVWNKWRNENPNVKIDLSEANLMGANLSGADLSWADLSGSILLNANLTKAKLRNANLTKANLNEVPLSSADLWEANLVEVNLFKANLMEANISKADLTRANLARADLSYAELLGSNLSGAYLAETNFRRADLSKANLTRANLFHAYFFIADLLEANFCEANLMGANLSGADLTKADLTKADLSGVNLSAAILQGATLQDATLEQATLVKTKIGQAKISNCYIHGLSVWDLIGIAERQENLIITPIGEAAITVDDLEVAQFIYLLLNNSKLKNVIDTITSKVVLILGRFTNERKAILNAIREKLRTMNLTPIVFDFDKPASKDVTGTVETLARMAKFIIADLTDSSSIPYELAMIVPLLRNTPVLPIRLQGSVEFSMFDDLRRDLPHRVLKTYEYADSASIIDNLAKVIQPADEMAEGLRNKK